MAVSAARLHISATNNLRSRDHEKHPDDTNVWSCKDEDASESRLESRLTYLVNDHRLGIAPKRGKETTDDVKNDHERGPNGMQGP